MIWVALTMVAVLAAALVRILFEAGELSAEIRRLKGENEALKMQIRIASRRIDAATAYDGLRENK